MFAKPHPSIFFVRKVVIFCVNVKRRKLEEHVLNLHKELRSDARRGMDCVILPGGEQLLVQHFKVEGSVDTRRQDGTDGIGHEFERVLGE